MRWAFRLAWSRAAERSTRLVLGDEGPLRVILAQDLAAG
jgi:hypothetical protein